MWKKTSIERSEIRAPTKVCGIRWRKKEERERDAKRVFFFLPGLKFLMLYAAFLLESKFNMNIFSFCLYIIVQDNLLAR